MVILLVAALPAPKFSSSVPASDELLHLSSYLESRGVPMNHVRIRRYLKALDQSGHDGKLAKKLIAQIGSDSFSERQSAEKSITASTVVPIELLREAALGEHSEKSFRAKRILDKTLPAEMKIVEKVLRSAELLKVPGITKEVLNSVTRFPNERRIVQLARRVIAVTATPEDINFLSAQMASKTTASVREVSISALRILHEKSLSDRFEFWARNHLLEESIRLEAALALADLGDRRSLSLLLEVMGKWKSPGFRSLSHIALRQLTGQTMDYSAYEEPEVRIKQIAAWKDWITFNGNSAVLNFPLRMEVSKTTDQPTLVAVTNRNCVLLLGKSSEVVWKFPCGYPRFAVRMDNGNILIVEYRRNRVIEVDRNKRIVREIPVKFPVNAQPMDNGNILICGHQGKSVVEVNPAGEVVWDFKPIKRSIGYAIRLDSGNTLLAEKGPRNPTIGEYTVDGTCIWKFVVDTDKSLSSIQPLGKNVLISIAGSAIEVNKKSNEIVWRYDRDGFRNAFRLDNGNTLLYANDCVLELDPTGQERWSKNVNREGREQYSGDDVSYGTVQQ